MTRTMAGMGWRVSSTNGQRWVAYDGAAWSADETTAEGMTAGAGQPVELAPLSEQYRPTGSTDPVGLYLLARYLVPGPVRVEGAPPQVPAPVGGYPPGTVH